MRNVDPLWSSSQAREYVTKRQPGGLVRIGRRRLGWRQDELGRRIGCSASTVSRLENGPAGDLRLLQRAAREVGVPGGALGAALGLTGFGTTTVAASRDEEDPMRRRSVLAAAGLVAPTQLLALVDDALAAVPAPTAEPIALQSRVAGARALFDAGRYTSLLEGLPGLLGAAHQAARTRSDLGYGRLSACYGLTAQALIKIERYDSARIAADRATVYADLSGSALAAAAATREMAIVLRHQGQPQAAQKLVTNAALAVGATGLTTDAQRSAYAQMLCTTAYTAAQSGDRAEALTMIREAADAARNLPDAAPRERPFPVTSAAVDAYAVSVHWALGDSGTALDIGSRLLPQQFPTAERRGRFHTDMARAWWQWGRPEQTAAALLAAARVAPAEVRDRPAIRRIVTDLQERHPLAPGVRALATV
ncbi:helix-turn-helix domain-containing protein [Actinacidiphila bryophytorum]|nr:helix-turn-helix transcriptional regulator [Actinacidiphila bryophytorum]MBM9435012.1 helix-turn-helix transcriptional regulator [Actinacidiphila bryophytorum]MBN6542113.1 helix-turn-helix transcriptional regulator [Actinacidiphila bryophytorum]